MKQYIITYLHLPLRTGRHQKVLRIQERQFVVSKSYKPKTIFLCSPLIFLRIKYIDLKLTLSLPVILMYVCLNPIHISPNLGHFRNTYALRINMSIYTLKTLFLLF